MQTSVDHQPKTGFQGLPMPGVKVEKLNTEKPDRGLVFRIDYQLLRFNPPLDQTDKKFIIALNIEDENIHLDGTAGDTLIIDVQK